MSNEFAIAEMTCFETAADGSSVRLDMEDVGGRPLSLHMPLECLDRLMMTLPGRVGRALQQRHRDSTLRMVYPVQTFQVELAGDLETRILTLKTADGFSASFGLTEEQCREIAADRRDEIPPRRRANRPERATRDRVRRTRDPAS
jgi:hypothetical protein